MYILSLLTVIRASFWCDNFVFQREKSLKCIIFHAPRTVPPTFNWNDNYPPLPPTILVSHVPFPMENAHNHSLPLTLYISHRVWLVCSCTEQFHHQTFSDKPWPLVLGHFTQIASGLASFEKYSCLAPYPLYNVEVWVLKLMTDLQHCLGRWGVGTDSHNTCERLLITV